MRACAWDARWSSATLRIAIFSRRAWRVAKGEMTVSAGFDDGCLVGFIDTTVVSSPSLLESLRLVLSPWLPARSGLGLLLSESVAALVSINGGGIVWSGEGGGGGGGGNCCGCGVDGGDDDDDDEDGVDGVDGVGVGVGVGVVHGGVVEECVVEKGVEFVCSLKLATPPPRDVITPPGGTIDTISFVHRRGCIATRKKKWWVGMVRVALRIPITATNHSRTQL